MDSATFSYQDFLIIYRAYASLPAERRTTVDFESSLVQALASRSPDLAIQLVRLSHEQLQGLRDHCENRRAVELTQGPVQGRRSRGVGASETS